MQKLVMRPTTEALVLNEPTDEAGRTCNHIEPYNANKLLTAGFWLHMQAISLHRKTSCRNYGKHPWLKEPPQEISKLHILIFYPTKPQEGCKEESRPAFQQFLVEVMTTIFTAPVIQGMGDKSLRKKQRESHCTRRGRDTNFWLYIWHFTESTWRYLEG
jgi:hypothetical protein